MTRVTDGERIAVSVEALELEGLDVREPARVRAAFQSELGRLIIAGGIPTRLAERPDGASLEGGTLTTHDVAHPERLGRAVAQLVYEELTR